MTDAIQPNMDNLLSLESISYLCKIFSVLCLKKGLGKLKELLSVNESPLVCDLQS